jgi:hypothetical protein
MGMDITVVYLGYSPTDQKFQDEETQILTTDINKLIFIIRISLSLYCRVDLIGVWSIRTGMIFTAATKDAHRQGVTDMASHCNKCVSHEALLCHLDLPAFSLD